MLKQHATIFRRVMIIADTALISACFLLAYALLSERLLSEPLMRYLQFLPLLLIVWLGLLYNLGMYRSLRLRSLPEIFIILTQTVLFGYVLIGWLAFIFNIDYIQPELITYTFLLSLLVLAAEKTLIILFFRRLRRKGFNYRTLLLVGSGPRAQKFLKAINSNRDFGFKIIGLIDDDPTRKGQKIEGHEVLGTLADIPDIIHRNVIDEAVFIVPRSWLDRIEPAMRFLEIEGIKTNLAVDHYNLRFAKIELNSLFDVPLLTFEPVHAGMSDLILKRFFDFIAAVCLLVLLSPVFVLIAIAIKCTSSGPVLFRQVRCSLNGRQFTLFKFRTMTADAESKLAEVMAYNQMTGPTFKMENDPRVMPLGRFLRKYSLDELPQLWNVLLGDMSMVGPRPPLPSEVERYDNWQRRRLTMRPGLTCLWQIQGRNNITDFDEWMRLDLKYIDEWSLWLDAKIVARTIPVVLFGIGAK